MAETLTKAKIEEDCYLYDNSGTQKAQFNGKIPWFLKYAAKDISDTTKNENKKKIIDSNQFYDRLGVQTVYCDVQFRINNTGKDADDWISLNSLNSSYNNGSKEQNNFIISLQTENEGVEKVKIELLDNSYEIIEYLLSIAIAIGQPNPTSPLPTIEWIKNNIDGSNFNSRQEAELYTKYSNLKNIYDDIIEKLNKGDMETAKFYRFGFEEIWASKISSDDYKKLSEQSKENIILTEFPKVLEKKQKVTTAALDLANFRLKKFGLVKDSSNVVISNLRYRFGYADKNVRHEPGIDAKYLGYEAPIANARWTDSDKYDPYSESAEGASLSRTEVLFSHNSQSASLSSWNEVYISDFSTTFTPSGIKYSILGIEARAVNLSKYKIVQRYANLVGTPLEVLHSLMWIFNYKGRKEEETIEKSSGKKEQVFKDGEIQIIWAEKEPIYQEMDTEEYAKIVKEAVKNTNEIIASGYIVDVSETETVKEHRKNIIKNGGKWVDCAYNIFEKTVESFSITNTDKTSFKSFLENIYNELEDSEPGSEKQIKIYFRKPGTGDQPYIGFYKVTKSEDGLLYTIAFDERLATSTYPSTRGDSSLTTIETFDETFKFSMIRGGEYTSTHNVDINVIFNEINKMTINDLEASISQSDLYDSIGKEIHCKFEAVPVSGTATETDIRLDESTYGMSNAENKIIINGASTGDNFIGTDSNCLISEVKSKLNGSMKYNELEVNSVFLKKFLDINVPAGWHAKVYHGGAGTIPTDKNSYLLKDFLNIFIPQYKEKKETIGEELSDEAKAVSEEIAKNKSSYFKKICIPLGTEESMMFNEESESNVLKNRNVLTKSVASILNSFCAQCPPKPSAEADEITTFIDENGEEKPVVKYNNYSERRLTYQTFTSKNDNTIYVYLFYNSPNKKVTKYRRYIYNSSNTNVLSLSITANSEYALLNAYSTKSSSSSETKEYVVTSTGVQLKTVTVGGSNEVDFNNKSSSRYYNNNKFAYNNINYTGEITILGDPLYKFDEQIVPYSIPIIIEAGYVSGYGAKESAGQYKTWKGSGVYAITKISHSISSSGFTTTLGIAKYPGIEKDFDMPLSL